MRSWGLILKTKNNIKGFTLVETVIVATIFSIVAVGVGSCFLSGMKLWQRAKNINFSQYDNVFTIEKLAKELRQAQDLSDIGFEGDANEVSFPVLSGDSILKVTYRFDSMQRSLMRGQVDFRDILAGKEQENYTERKVAELDSLVFNFLERDLSKDEYAWADGWEKESGVFPAIKLQGKLKGEEYNKTIFMPIFSQKS
ncbi:MAG: prepilin-type N-terminal cleavage/methylation domain-containing protein [Candidatus Omnitrophica bacterium]|nr:prepilin-type N-terminal cleavage/methylation domain-containing protein [Candidatus Omnitrophota bacterium]